MRRVLLAILAGIGLFASSSLPTPTLSSQEAVTTISVPATQPWTDTGLDLNQGDQVTVTASGIIKIAGSDPGKTPAGDQGCLQSETGVAPGLTCNSLIARIGEGTPFEIGTSLSFSVETAGRLYLGVNDDVRFFGDNSGSWTAEVEITESQADLQPTEIIFDASTAVVGDTIFFDSGVNNTGDIDTGVFNIKWFVDGQDVGAAGSHDGVPANSTVLDGNSQFSWVATEGTHTIEFAVDVDDHVEELDESNNSQAVTVTVSEDTEEQPIPYCYPGERCAELKPVDFIITLPWGTPTEELSREVLAGYGPSDSPVHDHTGRNKAVNDYYALDFGLSSIDDVRAVASGTVQWVGWYESTSSWTCFGTSVSIAHDGPGKHYTSFYAHLSSVRVSPGERIQQGHIIGQAGNTGSGASWSNPKDSNDQGSCLTFGSHLHWALYYKANTTRKSPPYGGQAVVPEPFRGVEDYFNIRLGQVLTARQVANGM